MDKLDEAIANTAYVLDCLRALRSIYETGDCNSCAVKDCVCKPGLGEICRYNCPLYRPFYVKDGEADGV